MLHQNNRTSPAGSGNSAETAPVQDENNVVSRISDSDSLSSSNCIAQADSTRGLEEDPTFRESIVSSPARLSGTSDG